MSLEYPASSGAKKKKRGLAMKKFNTKDLQQTLRLLSIGLSLGSGILGAAYLTSVGISPYITFIFGAGVLAVHINYIGIVTKNDRK